MIILRLEKMPHIKKILKINLSIGLALLFLSGSLVLAFQPNTTVQARSLSELQKRTEELQKEIDSSLEAADNLRQKGDTLRSAVDVLNKKIDHINTQSKLTITKVQELQAELVLTEKELTGRKELLKASMRALYKRSDASTVELLIGSDNFSAFIDEQEYLERLKLGVQDSTNAVIATKLKIQAQQNEQKALLEQQQAQLELINKIKQERESLLAETKGQEATYRARAKRLLKEQSRILSQIVFRSEVLTSSGSGGYPWANFQGKAWRHEKSCTYPGDGDPWGYCLRQCTSFSAWRLTKDGKNPPKGYGDAGNWIQAARANRIKTGNEPKNGAIAVWSGADFNVGHVAYVEEVIEGSSNKVKISEYNAVPAYGGRYSERIIDANDPTAYIYF